MPDSSSLPTTTPHASTADLLLYPPDSPHSIDDSFDDRSPLARPSDADAEADPDLDLDADAYDLVSPSDIESPASTAHRPSPSISTSSAKSDPPLPPLLLVPATLSPSLSLGALLLPLALSPLPPLSALFILPVLATLSSTSQSIWRAIGRYVRRESVEERVAEAVVGAGRGVRRERWKKRVGRAVGAGMVGTGVGLVVVYLRSAVLILNPLITPLTVSPAIPPLLGLGLSLACLPLLLPPAQRYLPLVHLALFILLLLLSLHTLFQSSLSTATASLEPPSTSPTWSTLLHPPRPALTSSAFFQSLSTLALLSISLSPPPQPPARPLLRYTPHLLSPLLTLPLALLPPTWPSASTFSPSAPLISASLLLLSAARIARTVLRSRLTSTRARLLTYALGTALLILCLALPEGWGFGELLWDLVLASCIWFGYVLPSLTHVILHHLRAPMAILFPQTPSSQAGGGDPTHDHLLLKKERSMQAKRETKRIVHDLVVFAALLPGGLIMWGWCLGRVVRLW